MAIISLHILTALGLFVFLFSGAFFIYFTVIDDKLDGIMKALIISTIFIVTSFLCSAVFIFYTSMSSAYEMIKLGGTIQ